MKTLHDAVSEIEPELIPLLAHPQDDLSWLHEWPADSACGTDIVDYLRKVQAVTQLTLDADAQGIRRIAADQCLTWAFG